MTVIRWCDGGVASVHKGAGTMERWWIDELEDVEGTELCINGATNLTGNQSTNGYTNHCLIEQYFEYTSSLNY